MHESVRVRVRGCDHHVSANVPTTRLSRSNEWNIAYIRDGGARP